jgi:PIN domain nuclease of toxin-antitoxin system
LIILDTHLFIWTNIAAYKIPRKIRLAMHDADTWGVPSISLWEVAMLEEKGRIKLPSPVLTWLRKALAAPKIKLVPITAEVAARSGSLPMHGDPADRLIAATAIEYDCSLATVDHNLLAFPELKTV